jgi:hypothetical protein
MVILIKEALRERLIITIFYHFVHLRPRKALERSRGEQLNNYRCVHLTFYFTNGIDLNKDRGLVYVTQEHACMDGQQHLKSPSEVHEAAAFERLTCANSSGY